jgi:UDP-3-O-[3-hydroxymyristoyl] glucosamine N-acyltransferase
MHVAHPPKITIIGVSSPYAWDVVETARRLGRSAVCVDNFGGADDSLPGLQELDVETDRAAPFTIGLASARHRAEALLNLEGLGFSAPESLVDPTSVLASTTRLGHCVYANAGVVVGSNTSLGCAVNLNRSASIGHDCAIGFGASIGPGAILAGGVIVREYGTVSTGATVLPGVSIGRGAFVGAGAVVTKDVDDLEVVVGNPAARMKVAQPISKVSTCPYC